MLNSNGFDLWADGYDAAVGLSDEDGSYPFAGYRKILGEIYAIIMGGLVPYTTGLVQARDFSHE